MRKLLLIVSALHLSVGYKTALIPDERFQPCDGPELGRGEPLELKGITINTDYVLLDDNKCMLNGTWTFKTRITSPWSVKIIGEKLERGVWTQRGVKNMKDACYDLFNPMDVFYTNLKTMKRCPLEKGVSR